MAFLTAQFRANWEGVLFKHKSSLASEPPQKDLHSSLTMVVAHLYLWECSQMAMGNIGKWSIWQSKTLCLVWFKSYLKSSWMDFIYSKIFSYMTVLHSTILSSLTPKMFLKFLYCKWISLVYKLSILIDWHYCYNKIKHLPKEQKQNPYKTYIKWFVKLIT